MISSGIDIHAILKGLHRALIKRIVAMIRSVNFIPPLLLSGGVVNNTAIRKMIEEEMGEIWCCSNRIKGEEIRTCFF